MSNNITADQGITVGLDLGDKHTQCCSPVSKIWTSRYAGLSQCE